MIFEGAQGVLLDVDFGSYPYVTSSNPSAGGILTGLGVGPKHIGEILGVAKAYTTRVGGGPFPSELKDKTGELIRGAGREYGASTGRPRRCGWFDAVAARYAVSVSGDREDRDDQVRRPRRARSDQGVHGLHDRREEERRFPAQRGRARAGRPRLRGVRRVAENLRASGRTRTFLTPRSATSGALEEKLGVGIVLVSTGPDEDDTIVRGKTRHRLTR